MNTLSIHPYITEPEKFYIKIYNKDSNPHWLNAEYSPIEHTISIFGIDTPINTKNIPQYSPPAHNFAELHAIIQQYTPDPYYIEIHCHPNCNRLYDPYIAIVFHSNTPNIVQQQYQRSNHRAGTMLLPIPPWNMDKKPPAHTPFADLIGSVMNRFRAYYLFDQTIPHSIFHINQLTYTNDIITDHRIALRVRCLTRSIQHPYPIILLGFSIHGTCIHHVVMKNDGEGYAIPLQRLIQRTITKIHRYQQETSISTHETIAICRAFSTILHHHRANVYHTIAYARRLYAIHYGEVPKYIPTEPDITIPY